MADTSTPDWTLLYEGGRQALQLRKLQEAEQSFSAALQLAEDFPAGDPRLAATLNALARIYSLQRRYLAAAALLNRLLEVTERTLGPSHAQVAGVLANLAEMYTHLGAAREELELRERVLAIREHDASADAASLGRLRERVAELRSLLASQEEPAEEDDDLPEVTERLESDSDDSKLDVAAMQAEGPEPESLASTAAPEPPTDAARPAEPAVRLFTPRSIERPITPLGTAPVARGLSDLPLIVMPPADVPVVRDAAPLADAAPAGPRFASPTALAPRSMSVPRVSVPNQPVVSSGEPHTHRTEAPFSHTPLRKSRRSSLFSIAAGALLVAGVLAARNYVTAPPADDSSESAGTVSLVNGATKPAVSPAPVVEAEPRTVERLVSERRLDRQTTEAPDPDYEAAREADRLASSRPAKAATTRPPRAPTALERARQTVDGALKTIDDQARAAADSAMAMRMRAPAFKKVRLADP